MWTQSRESATVADLIYLSYPRLADKDGIEYGPDSWIERFATDLAQRLTLLSPSTVIGTLDGGPFGLDHGTDATERRAAALARTQVFIPLVSPDYVVSPTAMNEWSAFRQRLATNQDLDTVGHVLPIVWAPVPGADLVAFRKVFESRDIRSYGEAGLSHILRLGDSESYDTLLDRIARRVLITAGEQPLRPSPPADLRAPRLPGSRIPFVVTVIAPSRLQSSLSLSGPYGDHPEKWRPFGPDFLPAAEYAVNAAEQLDLPVWLSDFATSGGLLATRPGLVLVDPYSVRHPNCLAMLTSVAADIREVPVILVEVDELDQADQLAQCTRRVKADLGDELANYVSVVRGAAALIELLRTAVPVARGRLSRTPRPALPTVGDFPQRPRLRDPMTYGEPKGDSDA